MSSLWLVSGTFSQIIKRRLIAAQAVCLGYKHTHPKLRLGCHFFGWDAILKNSSGIP